MFRGLAVAAAMLAALATGAAGQSSVGVSAVVVEETSYFPLDLQWQPGAQGRLVVTPRVPEPGVASRFVEQVWLARAVSDVTDATATATWRRTDAGLEWAMRGAPVLLELLEGLEAGAYQVPDGGATADLILVRVIASNS